jgi:hypothetical protein
MWCLCFYWATLSRPHSQDFKSNAFELWKLSLTNTWCINFNLNHEWQKICVLTERGAWTQSESQLLRDRSCAEPQSFDYAQSIVWTCVTEHRRPSPEAWLMSGASELTAGMKICETKFAHRQHESDALIETNTFLRAVRIEYMLSSGQAPAKETSRATFPNFFWSRIPFDFEK